MTNSAGTLDGNGRSITVGQNTNIDGGTVLMSTGNFTGTGGYLFVNGGTLTGTTGLISAAALQISAGTLNAPTAMIVGSWTKTGGTFNPGSGTVYLNSQPDTIQSGGGAFNNLSIMNGAGYYLLDALDVNGILSIGENDEDAAELHGAGYAINVAGDFMNYDNNFYAEGSTVTFDGTGVQRVYSNGTYAGFRALTSGATLQFDSGYLTNVTSMLELANVSLKSETNGATWYLNLSGSSQTVSNVRVRDSSNGGNVIFAPNSSNLGNNNGWSFNAANTYSSVQTGNWHAPATWGGVVPSTSATVMITSPNVVTSTSGIIVSSITVAGTLTLQGNSTFYWMTTNSGSTLNQGANQIYFSSKTVLGAGTFQKNAAGRVYLNGNYDLKQNNNNLGNTYVGTAP
jgi:hypothetical protein